jgi:hypothetical protein
LPTSRRAGSCATRSRCTTRTSSSTSSRRTRACSSLCTSTRAGASNTCPSGCSGSALARSSLHGPPRTLREHLGQTRSTP